MEIASIYFKLLLLLFVDGNRIPRADILQEKCISHIPSSLLDPSAQKSLKVILEQLCATAVGQANPTHQRDLYLLI